MDENNNLNVMKYDPVTGEPIQDIPQQVVQPIIQQPAQPVQPQMQQPMQQPVQPQMQQPVQPGQPQMVPPLSQQHPGYVQPINQQQVGYAPVNSYGQPVNYVVPQQQGKHPDDTDPQAKKLLLAAVIAFVAGHIIPTLGSQLDSGSYDVASSLGTVLIGFGTMVYIASLILMIVLRVRYPKNQGGKILMYVMIIEIALAVISVVLFLIACYAIMDAMGCYGFLL